MLILSESMFGTTRCSMFSLFMSVLYSCGHRNLSLLSSGLVLSILVRSAHFFLILLLCIAALIQNEKNSLTFWGRED